MLRNDWATEKTAWGRAEGRGDGLEKFQQLLASPLPVKVMRKETLEWMGKQGGLVSRKLSKRPFQERGSRQLSNRMSTKHVHQCERG